MLGHLYFTDDDKGSERFSNSLKDTQLCTTSPLIPKAVLSFVIPAAASFRSHNTPAQSPRPLGSPALGWEGGGQPSSGKDLTQPNWFPGTSAPTIFDTQSGSVFAFFPSL